MLFLSEQELTATLGPNWGNRVAKKSYDHLSTLGLDKLPDRSDILDMQERFHTELQDIRSMIDTFNKFPINMLLVDAFLCSRNGELRKAFLDAIKLETRMLKLLSEETEKSIFFLKDFFWFKNSFKAIKNEIQNGNIDSLRWALEQKQKFTPS